MFIPSHSLPLSDRAMSERRPREEREMTDKNNLLYSLRSKKQQTKCAKTAKNVGKSQKSHKNICIYKK